ncbi:hypothetical protein SEPCBS119000_003664 [Sporothrix epigloea]|uniref:N-acetyltransferase domain-containing protein n=1 Tax=Sporothrix epigloea TaxID=1892477 RepID=A0ABP0DQN4_9PEZI
MHAGYAAAGTMTTSDAMIDPAIAGPGVSTVYDSPHHHFTDSDGQGDDQEDEQGDNQGDDASTDYDADDFFAPDPQVPYSTTQPAPPAPATKSATPATPATPAKSDTPPSAPSSAPTPVTHSLSAATAAAAAAAAVATAAALAAAPAATVHRYDPGAHGHLVLYLAALHGSRITADNLSGSFVPPLNHEKLLDWWRTKLTTSAVFLLLRKPSDEAAAAASAAAAKKIKGTDLAGVIVLSSHPAETSPHVAAVDLLLVNLPYRQLGGERMLLQTVEQKALLEGRTLLTAETESNSSMATTYKLLGFTEAGRVPGMVLRPASGEKRAMSIFYKTLR